MEIPNQYENPTNYHRTENELQVFLLFCIFVSGKRSDVQQKKLEEFLSYCWEESPFDWMLGLQESSIYRILEVCKVGQYNRLAYCLTLISSRLNGNLTTATLENLEKIKGIGPKTARFFLLHTRHDCECAVLDTHVLAWLRERGHADAPKTTPPAGKQYRKWEAIFLQEIKQAYPRLSVAAADYEIWAQRNLSTNTTTNTTTT